MTNISQQVRDYLNKNPYIIKSIAENIINLRALSVNIIKSQNLDASVHAVMSALRRYTKELTKKSNKQVDLVLKNSRISTKSRLLMITVKRHFRVLKNLIPDIMDRIHVSQGEVLRLVEGRESIRFIIDTSKKEEILSLVPKEEFIGITPNLAELNIHLSDKHGDIPGLLSPILQELSANDINLIQVIGSMPELIIIVKEDDISKAHDTLLRFFYGMS